MESTYNELGYNEIPLLTNEPPFPGTQPSLCHYLFAAYNEQIALTNITNSAFSEQSFVSREAIFFKILLTYNEQSNLTGYNEPYSVEPLPERTQQLQQTTIRSNRKFSKRQLPVAKGNNSAR